MFLTIDIGNTLTKALAFDDAHPVGDAIVGPSETTFIKELLTSNRDKKIALATVITLDESVLEAIQQQQVLLVDGKTPLPITSSYSTPHTLGVDRICAAVAANYYFPTNAVLAIDMGTCITYDIVSETGEYLGGNISPGLRMRFRALSDYTSKLPHLEPLFTSSWIGKSTDEAMQIGVQHSILTELQGTIDALSTQFSNLKIVATGGDFPFFANDLKTPIFADPFLVLRGLYEILRYNH